eukprot:Gregarina_sp_Pseudo_9__5840@NODE_89_length_4367_cov_71_081100_g81_i0_p1_GENE_NODE_89_length_4367_cov_71_081100_g81_i0NODE_89_length_4367_cov_71_081100_g81_i0_p1_ORF_typecomplete_len358_score40_19_NODE_89_length_4367_cov_71_081100_g81_i032594332
MGRRLFLIFCMPSSLARAEESLTTKAPISSVVVQSTQSNAEPLVSTASLVPVILGDVNHTGSGGSTGDGILAVAVEGEGSANAYVGSVSDETDSYLGDKYGVIVAIPPRLSEPEDVDYSAWLPTAVVHLSDASVVAQEEAEALAWEQSLHEDLDEVWKRAVQNVYYQPEPLLARALALLKNDTQAEQSRRLKEEFHSARRRALLADRAASELTVVEQQALITSLLSESPPSSSVGDNSSVAGQSGTAALAEGAESVASASGASGGLSSGSGVSGGVSSASGGSSSSGATLAVDPGVLVNATAVTTAGPIAQLNSVLSNINQALGGVTTATVSPQIAIAQGVQNFISGLNLLALQLAK